MRDDYKLLGAVTRIDIQVEQQVADRLAAMEKHTKIGKSELVNTALKRFISQHKDFMPAGMDVNPASHGDKH